MASCGNQLVARLEPRGCGPDTLHVDVGVATHLELEAPIALVAIPRHATCHRLRLLLRDRAVENEVLAPPASQQRAYGKFRHLAEDVPALERGIHALVQALDLERALAEEMWTQLRDARTRTGRVGR
jgi:hypothetical protein